MDTCSSSKSPAGGSPSPAHFQSNIELSYQPSCVYERLLGLAPQRPLLADRWAPQRPLLADRWAPQRPLLAAGRVSTTDS